VPTLFEHAELYMQALDEAGMPSDAEFREVPRWTWAGDDPGS
jgi:hypothetical protein